MTQRMTILTDRAAEHLASGVRRRLEHHLVRLAESGTPARHVHLYQHAADDLRGTLHRARAVSLDGLQTEPGPVTVIGLGDVGLMIVADRLARSGFDVVYDQCDSMVLQLRVAVMSARAKDVVWGGLRCLTRRRIDRRVAFGYISHRDRRWDRPVNLGRTVTVAAANVDPALLALERVGATIDRISVPADFASPHLGRGLGMLWDAIRESSPIRFDLFGPVAPSVELPASARYLGFAEDITTVYEGDTAVFIANIGGAGVPNKLLEAASAGRPVIVHPSVRHRVDVAVRGWTYRSSVELRGVLEGIARGQAPADL